MHQLQQETQQLKQLAGLEGKHRLPVFPSAGNKPGKVLSGEVAQLSVSKVIAQIKTKGSGLLMNEAEMGFLDTVLKAVESKDPVALKALQEAAQQVGAGLVAENKGPEGKAPVVAPAPVAAQEKAPASSHLVIDKTDAHNQYAWRYLAERR